MHAVYIKKYETFQNIHTKRPILKQNNLCNVLFLFNPIPVLLKEPILWFIPKTVPKTVQVLSICFPRVLLL